MSSGAPVRHSGLAAALKHRAQFSHPPQATAAYDCRGCGLLAVVTPSEGARPADAAQLHAEIAGGQ